MKNLSTLIAFIFLVQAVAFGQTVAPEKIQKDSLQLGRASTGANKSFIFDTGDGGSNKSLLLNGTTKEFTLNSKLNVTGGVSATGAVSAGGAISTTTGDISTSSGNISASGSITAATSSISGTARHQSGTTIGSGTNASKQITVDRAGFDPYLKWDETSQKWVFSNDGSVEKKLGSGSGGDTGITVLQNGSFEDGKNVDWTSSGGTYNSFTYGNPPDNDSTYVSLVASASGQYFESTLHAIPTNVTGGCLAKIDYYTTDAAGTFKLQIYDGSSNLLREDSLPVSNWFPYYSPIPCPTPGTTVKMRVISTAAGTILADHAYLGKENRTYQAHCQGTLACETTYRFRVTTGGVVADDDFDIVNGNCSLSGTSSENKTCTWNGGIFTVAPIVEATSCEATDLSGVDRNVSVTGLTTLKAIFTTRVTNNSSGDNSFCVSVTKTGADLAKAKPQTAISPPAQDWFVDVNIGGANPSLGTAAVSTYAEITNASLDMVLNTGSAAAKIPCSSTNASTGLTCSAGNEGVGVVFTPPFAGWFEACIDFSHLSSVTSGLLAASFELIETSPSSQTLVQEGRTRLSDLNNTSAASTQVNSYPFHNCGWFNFTSATERTLRLMYEQSVSGTINSSSVTADRAAATGQQDIRIVIRPLLSAFNRSYLFGDQIVKKFSSDQATFTFSPTYTPSTLSSAPIGTYIAFTGGASAQCTTQMATGPTNQTDSSKTTDGFLLVSKVFTAASTAGVPCRYDIQIGKGLKGYSVTALTGTGRSGNVIDMDFFTNSPTDIGIFQAYNEATGVLSLNSGFAWTSNSTRWLGVLTDGSSVTTGYALIQGWGN